MMRLLDMDYKSLHKIIGPKCGLFGTIEVFDWKILSLHSVNLYSKVRKLNVTFLNNFFLGKGDR